MNWLIRLGQWWEERRVLRWSDYRELRQKADNDAIHFSARLGDKANLSDLSNVFLKLEAMSQRLDAANSYIEEIKKASALPELVKEMAIIKQQMDRLELYVGLKREPQATHVQGAPKIS